MPAANRIGNVSTAYQGRQVERGRATGEYEQADLGRGVEAEAEQQADRIHLPGLGDRLGRAAEDAVHQAALVQLLLEGGLVEVTRPHPAEHFHDADQDHQVQDRDDVEEDPGDRRTDHAGDLLQGGRVVRDLTGQRADTDAEQETQAEHHRRVAQ
jgi:hypothetical protein